MPELPEVETARRGIEPWVLKQTVKAVTVRNSRLRWPVPTELPSRMQAKRIVAVQRRGKYLLLSLAAKTERIVGTAIIHLGMSGVVRIVDKYTVVAKHDHVDIRLSNDKILRYTDPRRFGCVLWCEGDPGEHKLLSGLGPEPLSKDFDGDHLFTLSRQRKTAVKAFIMDAAVVVGVGNIYANEALFLAGIRPDRKAGKVSRKRYRLLAQQIKHVLEGAIQQGGTTLKDFVGGDGKPGYFKQALNVYGRAAQPCVTCHHLLTEIRLGQRSTVFCKRCQS